MARDFDYKIVLGCEQFDHIPDATSQERCTNLMPTTLLPIHKQNSPFRRLSPLPMVTLLA